MGRIRSGLGDGYVGRNIDHLNELCELLKDPYTSVKQLNTLYALRTAWASRGYLLDRELLIIRTTTTGEYVSRAELRASKGTTQHTRDTTLSSETFFGDDKVTIGNGSESVTETNVVTQVTNNDRLSKRGAK